MLSMNSKNWGPVPVLAPKPAPRDREREYERAANAVAVGFDCHCQAMKAQAEHNARVRAAREAEVKARKERRAAGRASQTGARNGARNQAGRARNQPRRQPLSYSAPNPGAWLSSRLNPRPERFPLPKQPEHMEVLDLMMSECVDQGAAVAEAVADQLVKVLFDLTEPEPFEPEPDPELFLLPVVGVRSDIVELFAGLAVNMNAKGWEVEDQPDGDEGQTGAIRAFEAGLHSRAGVSWSILTQRGFCCEETATSAQNLAELADLPYYFEPAEGAVASRADIAILAEGTPAAPGKPDRRF